MKSLIIKVKCNNGMLLNYIEHKIDNLPKLQHKLRIKQVIYGELFHVYHKEMNFSKSNIVVDNRY